MKNLNIIFVSILVIFILFTGSCATKKKAYKDLSSGSSAPHPSVSGSEEYVYEFDVFVDVDPQKMAEPRADYPEEITPVQSRPTETIEPESYEAQLTPQPNAETMELPAKLPAESDVAANETETAVGSDTTESTSSVETVVTGDRAFGSPGGPGGKERRNCNLVSAGSVNVEGVIDYIKIRNRVPGFNEEHARRIINAYVDEAVKEDVNYDFAIAQMLYWTAFFTNKQRVESNNLAGLQSTKTWNGTFPTAEEGVRAHIQHLRGYSHKTLKDPKTKNIDPRWDQISNFRGTIKNFEQIYPRWSQSTARYRRNIILILNDMHRYSDRYSSLYK